MYLDYLTLTMSFSLSLIVMTLCLDQHIISSMRDTIPRGRIVKDVPIKYLHQTPLKLIVFDFDASSSFV